MSYIHGKSLIRIAMAEDHAMLRETLCTLINTWDQCKVVMQADNGKDLIEQINGSNVPDLAILDLQMPVMNGYDTICLLKHHHPTVKIIVISIFASEECLLRLIRMGIGGFIFKGEKPDKLKTAIYEVMRVGYYFAGQASGRILREVIKSGEVAIKNALTERDLQFLKHIVTDKTYKEIAYDMRMSERQIEYLRASLFERFEVESRTGLAVQALKRGLTI